MLRSLVVAALSALLLSASPTSALPRLLLFTRTVGYRHDSIPTAVDVLTRLGTGALRPPQNLVDPSAQDVTWDTVHSEDDRLFENYDNLTSFDAIAFAFTTDVDPPGVGTILSDNGASNLRRYVQSGGGFVGIHSAPIALYPFPWYGRLVGSFFDYHPALQMVTVSALDKSHPSTSRFPDEGIRINEEMYHFRTDARTLPSPAHSLISNATAYSDPGVNPSGFRNGTDGPLPRPLSWWREGGLLDAPPPGVKIGGGLDDAEGTPVEQRVSGGPGRAWVSTLGHDQATWAIDAYRGYVKGGIAWVLASQTIRARNTTASVGQSAAQAASSTPATVINSSSASSSSSSSSANSALGATLAKADGAHVALLVSLASAIALGAVLVVA